VAPWKRTKRKATATPSPIPQEAGDAQGSGNPKLSDQQQRAKDEQVERALEHFDAFEFVFSRHSRWRIEVFTSNVKGSGILQRRV
jgi:hypothetical protein